MKLNEIALSDDLKIIEMEINHHKNIAGQSIWEIGRRLNHVKENELVHGEFRKWHESLGIDKDFASKSMRVAIELPNVETFRHLGATALSLIATLPEEERNKGHITEKGESKTPDEMTVKELQNLKKQLKENEESYQRVIRQKDEIIDKTYDALQKAKNNKETVVLEKEVAPKDYDYLKEQNKRLVSEMNSLELKYESLEMSTLEAQQLKRAIDKLKVEKTKISELIDNTNDFYNLIHKIDDFFKIEMAHLRFKPLINKLQGTEAINDLRETIGIIDHWVSEMNQIIPTKNIKIIEGEFENE